MPGPTASTGGPARLASPPAPGSNAPATQVRPVPIAAPAAPVAVSSPVAAGGAQAAPATPDTATAAPANPMLPTAPVVLALPLPAHPPPAHQPVPPPSRRPRWRGVHDYLGDLGVLQVICWQLAVLAVALTARRPWPILTAVSIAAAVLLALTTGRVGGRWLYRLVGLAATYLVRDRRRDLPESGRTPALLDLLVPGATVLVTETGQGPAMTVSHRGGQAVLLRPTNSAEVPGPAALLPVVAGQRFAVQVVRHAGVRRDGPAKVWLSVHATRTVDLPGEPELTLVLRNALRRVRRAAGRAGTVVEPLAEEPAFAALAGLAHVTGGRNEVREDWRFWRTGPVCQATFRISGFHLLADGPAARLVGALFAATNGVAATVTLTARTGCPVNAVLRLAGTTEAAVGRATAAAGDALETAAAPELRLNRLDGQHAAGVAVSLPIGVFLP